MKVRSTFLALAAAAAATMSGLAATPAMAGEPAIAVPYTDINLASPAGRERLGHRVFQAATMLCGRYDPRELRLNALAQACRSRAIASVRPQLDALSGGARYASRSVSQAAF